MAPRDKERRSQDAKSSYKAPPKKAGGGGKFTVGKAGDEAYGSSLQHGDPNYDPEERRVDPEDGAAYTWDEMCDYYRGKFKKKALEEYWEYEMTPAKVKKSSKAGKKAGPTPAESLPQPKAKVKAGAKGKPEPKRLSADDMDTDGPLAKEVAAVIPYFPYKKIERFYDVQGLLKHPKLFNAVCSVMTKRYRKMGITKICAFDARGFLFTPVSIKLNVPFVMLRKGGKMPNTISSGPYTKEYEGVDEICIQKGAVVKGDKVILLDDLIATGGTLCAGIKLIQACEAEVTECSCMIELEALGGRDKCLKAGAKGVWTFMTEEILQNAAVLPDDYIDDGKH
eukprot:TRINITY_DN75769_c0_g1_i1.p1 TRINITY_DN75769_c0_g1~~TRINITY_DN75769_c0_g1_i1.p1  ORF type:complete len:352 (+),score=88.62 TRINITY_DN75769_c0_g1_i1:43-1056(+)